MSHAVISEIEKTFFLFYPINVSLFEIFKIIDRLKFLIISIFDIFISGSWIAFATQNQHFDIHWRKWPLFPLSKSCNSSNVFSKILGILFRPWMFIYLSLNKYLIFGLNKTIWAQHIQAFTTNSIKLEGICNQNCFFHIWNISEVTPTCPPLCVIVSMWSGNIIDDNEMIFIGTWRRLIIDSAGWIILYPVRV